MAARGSSGDEGGVRGAVGQARLAGLLYLYIIVAGIFSEAAVRSVLIDYSSGSETAARILGSEALYRGGLVLEIAMHLCDAAVAVLFYVLFRPAGPVLSAYAAALRIVVTAMAGVRSLLLLTPLMLLKGGDYLAPFTIPERQALTLFFLRLSNETYAISLVFFGVSCLAVAWLIVRSRLLPRAIGLLMGLAGVCYLINSFAGFLAPAFAGALFPYILLPCLIGEGALALWLTVFGVDRERWRALSGGSGLPG